jgi:DNA-binding XRE family transcriptional regulator
MGVLHCFSILNATACSQCPGRAGYDHLPAQSIRQGLRACPESRPIGERGLSQEELAGRADFDRTYPSLLEHGRRSPTFFVILQLAGALRMEPVVLFAPRIAEAVSVWRREGQP